MTGSEPDPERIDWSVTTWEGSRREQLRRWAALPLERIVAAVEEMEEVTHALRQRQERSSTSVFLRNRKE